MVEVPITFTERERGQSKMSSSIVREALWRVTVWGATARILGQLGALLATQDDLETGGNPADVTGV